MQTNLFSDENLSKNEFIKNLKIFSLDNARHFLDEWAVSINPPTDLKAMQESLELLNEEYDKAENKIDFLLELKIHPKNLVYYKGLTKFFPTLQNGINNELADSFPLSADYLKPGLHISEIYLDIKDYKRAVKSSDLALEKYGEDALLRQINGFALNNLSRYDEAKQVWTFAYFNDPLACREEYIGAKQFLNKYNYLKAQFSDPEMVWLILPLELWHDGLTHITPQAENYLNTLREKTGQNSDQSPKGKLLQFMRLLYLAEAIRINSSRGHQNRELTHYREEMKKVYPEKFEIYLNKLREFAHL